MSQSEAAWLHPAQKCLVRAAAQCCSEATWCCESCAPHPAVPPAAANICQYQNHTQLLNPSRRHNNPQQESSFLSVLSVEPQVQDGELAERIQTN